MDRSKIHGEALVRCISCKAVFPQEVTMSPKPDTFQRRVAPWMQACFGAEISADRTERNHRFLEEALELVQASGCTSAEAHQLVDYVYGRPIGDVDQEIGGVMVTLAALCLANGTDMYSAGETELQRVWGKVEQIRAKQAAKPKHSPLPGASVAAPPHAATTIRGLESEARENAARIEAQHREIVRLREEVAQSAWQPIETAPKTTNSRLVWCPERRNVHLVSWWQQENTWTHFGPGGRILMETPTHWRPVPGPPDEPQAGGAPTEDEITALIAHAPGSARDKARAVLAGIGPMIRAAERGRCAEEVRALRALVTRLTDVADDLSRQTSDPGTEALAAIHCGRHFIYG